MIEKAKHEVYIYSDLEEASQTVAEILVKKAQEALSQRGFFSIALPGGETPRRLYRLLSSKYSKEIPWKKTHLFLGDERYVPKNHKESNYAMIHDLVISKVSVPIENVHRIPTEITPPERCAAVYDVHLKEFFKPQRGKNSVVTFDVSLLGLGEDGHTASLFPGDASLIEEKRWVVPMTAPPGFSVPQRISLTLPAFSSSKSVIFLVSGANKSAVLRSIIEDKDRSKRVYPPAMIQPREQLLWFIEKEALNKRQRP